MTEVKYSGAHATNAYISISEDGDVEAGMILDDGYLLKAGLKLHQDQVEVQRQSKLAGKDHSVTLERLSDGTIVRTTVYYGMQFSKQSFSGQTDGEMWLSGERVRD
jgi:hypothetical protein